LHEDYSKELLPVLDLVQAKEQKIKNIQDRIRSETLRIDQLRKQNIDLQKDIEKSKKDIEALEDPKKEILAEKLQA
jgi:TolA-binding protein